MPGQRGLQRRVIGWAAVAVLAAYALFVGGAWAPTFWAPYRVLTLILAIVGIVVWMVVAARNPEWRPRSALAPAFAAALLAFLLSTVMSRYPRFGFEYLAWSILLVALYLILQRLMASPFFRARLISFAVIAGVVIGLWYVAAVFARWFEWWSLVGRLTAPPLRPGFESLMLGNPSAVMTASVLLAAPAVAMLWGASRTRSAIALLIVLLSLFVVVASGSRAGWLAVGLASVVVGGLWLLAPDHRGWLTSALRSRWVKVGLVPVALVVGIVAVAFGPGLMIRAGSGGENLRFGYVLSSLRMFESSPILGTGPGTWAPLRVANTVAGETDYYIPHAHNLFVETLAEFGVIGVMAGLVAAFFLGRLLLRSVRAPDPKVRHMGWAALFATAYFAAHQLLDFYANLPAILFAFAIPVAWLDAAQERDPTHPKAVAAAAWLPPRARPVLAAGGIAVILVAAGYLGWSERAALEMEDGTSALNGLAYERAIPSLERAVAIDPAMPPYHLALGLALANTGQPARAELEFMVTAEADDLPEAWLNLAAIRLERGDEAGATAALARAARLGYQQAAIALAAGDLWLELGRRDDAIEAFESAVLLLPSLAGDPWWRADEARERVWHEVSERVLAKVPATVRFEMALEAADLASAGEAVEAIESLDGRDTFQLILEAWDGNPEEVAALEQRARERPLDGTIVNWCARVLRRIGDDAGAQRYVQWAETLTALSSTAGFQARIVGDDASFIVGGINSLFYGHFTYRRPTPSNHLINGLPHVALE
jgi:tetratricopeptide (TPR) repeat protein